MDEDTDLDSASRRLNMVLVSKGLLEETAQIKFHDIGQTRRVINFIYEIIKRRDKDNQYKENLINSSREQKSRETVLKKENAQLESRIKSLERQVNLIKIQRDTFQTTVKTLELQNKGFQDDINRHKTLLLQLKAQCANDRRKMDQRFLRMKEKAGFDIRRMKIPSIVSGRLSTFISSMPESADVSQSAETLAVSYRSSALNVIPELMSTLTNENAKLVALLREVSLVLNVFTGEKAVSDAEFQSVLEYTPNTFPELSIEINNSLSLLRELLQEPKYVSVDEVSKRNEEIEDLKGQLEAMSNNWRDAITTMNEWNREMESRQQPEKLCLSQDRELDSHNQLEPEISSKPDCKERATLSQIPVLHPPLRLLKRTGNDIGMPERLIARPMADMESNEETSFDKLQDITNLTIAMSTEHTNSKQSTPITGLAARVAAVSPGLVLSPANHDEDEELAAALKIEHTVSKSRSSKRLLKYRQNMLPKRLLQFVDSPPTGPPTSRKRRYAEDEEEALINFSPVKLPKKFKWESR
ncbi:Afadin and alpha-actinin-binding-domain-containing protein [Lipomyces oligophaga]|uniref:Afadin and alpha-actinin-binding-domain-containing protein n=1 Tax=Lipomyces oligophaga TaxID=45792 RepID=UPI0034CE0985